MFGTFENLVEKYRTGNTNVVKPSTTTNTSSTPSSNTTTAYKVGDLVKITNGAVYTNGNKVPSWVLNTKWYLSNVSDTRVVLGKSEDGKSNIQSPINAKYISKVDISSTNNSSTSYDIKDVEDFKVNFKRKGFCNSKI